MQTIDCIINAMMLLVSIISAFYFMRAIYLVIGVFTTRHFKPAKKQFKYAILVAARNEENVIGNLIESVRAQDYPAELVDVFVVADNCTDQTARVARSYGVHCYERNDPDHRTKGFALQFLVKCIDRDFGVDSYDGYFIFDADNILKEDYITRMNEAFDAGEKIIVGYRNTKNFDDNWISASYGIHWLRTARFEHRARSLLHLATRIQGTGFLFAWELIKDGWNYTGLTEDRAFCADAVANGYKISYNDKAEFYDEQPTDIKIAMRQRIRWAKGNLQAVTETGGKLFRHMFVTGGASNRGIPKTKENRPKRLFNNLRQRFMSFDMLTIVFPDNLVAFIKDILVFFLRLAGILISATYVAKMTLPGLVDLLNIPINLVTDSTAQAILLMLLITAIAFIIEWLGGVLTAISVFILDSRRIMKIKWYKKLWFCITFPIFPIIGKITMLIALFTKVEWKPIPHTADISIDEMNDRLHNKQTERELSVPGGK